MPEEPEQPGDDAPGAGAPDDSAPSDGAPKKGASGDIAEEVITRFAKGLNVLSAIWLAGVALLIIYDVLGREFFLAPFQGTNEIVSNSVLSILLLQLPLSILTRGSLRTTIFYGRAGLRGKRAIDALSYALALVLFAVIAIGSWPNMIEGWAIFEAEGSGNIQIPVYLVRTLVVVVCSFGALVCAFMIHRAVSRRGRAAYVSPRYPGD